MLGREGQAVQHRDWSFSAVAGSVNGKQLARLHAMQPSLLPAGQTGSLAPHAAQRSAARESFSTAISVACVARVETMSTDVATCVVYM
eukprot:5278395-Pleurochrysis_carterae.AAC.5